MQIQNRRSLVTHCNIMHYHSKAANDYLISLIEAASVVVLSLADVERARSHLERMIFFTASVIKM